MIRGFACATFGCFAAMGACSTYGATDPPASTPDASVDAPADSASDAAVAPDVANDADPNTAADAHVPFCTRDMTANRKLCDDFDDGVLGKAPWSGVQIEPTLSASALTIVSGTDRLLRVTVPPVMGQSIHARLLHGIPAQNTSAEGTVSVALRLRTIGFDSNSYVEIVSLALADARVVSLALQGGSLRLVATGAGSAIIPGDLAVMSSYRLTYDGTSATVLSAQNAVLVQLAVDGGAFTSSAELRVGLVFTDATSGGTIDIDDVVVSY